MKKYHPEKFRGFKSISAKPSGFTLIEILIALVIIGLLAGISIPLYNDYLDKAKLAVSINTLGSVRRAIDDYYLANSAFPPAIDMTTGEDGLGKIVLDSELLADFHKTLFSMESYSPSTTNYTLTARANDRKHSLLILMPGQVVTQGP
jgi:prepilin-type N-terminal cleavage/methylation domain-containing protein